MLEMILDSMPEESFLKAEGFDKAVIGVDAQSMRLIYSKTKCINILMRDMDEDEAIDFFEFNVAGSYVGEKTPIWCEDFF